MTPEPRDYFRARDVVVEIAAATLEVVNVWPISTADPRAVRLAQLVDRHGLFTVLTVALGWAGVEVRQVLNVPPGESVTPGSYDLAYPSRPLLREIDGVVAKLLEHALVGVDGVPALYDAAAMLRHNGEETARVLAGVLDLCAALRLHTVLVGRRG